MKKIKALIFDLDGTLLNTLGDLAAAVNHTLINNGRKALTEETIKTYVGNGAGKLIERCLLKGSEDPLYEKILSEFSAYYKENSCVKTAPYEGIVPMLEALKNYGIKTAVLSNKPHSATCLVIEHYFGNLIDLTLGERKGIKRKPDPAGIYEILKNLKLSNEEVIYVGDSDVDIATAKNSSVKCLSCLWGFKSEKFLKEHGAENIISLPSAILNYI